MAFRLPADHVRGLVYALLQLAARDLVVVRGHVARFDGIQTQEIDDVHAEFFSGKVPALFDRPVRGRIAEAAKCTGGNEIGIDEGRIAAHARVLVECIVAHAGGAEDRLRFSGVGAVVGEHPDLFGLDAAITGEAQPHPVAHRHARMAGEKLFFASVDELDRLAGLARENRAYHGRVVVARFPAKAAADFRLHDAHAAFRNAQCNRIASAREKRRLRIAPQRYAVARPLRNTTDGFERGVPLARALPRAFNDDVARLEAAVDIAALERKVMGDVAWGIVVHQRRAGRECCIHRQHRGQNFVFDLDPVDGSARGFCIPCGNRRDFIADVAHLVDGEWVEVGAKAAPFFTRGIGAGDYGFDAGQRGGRAGVDVLDARMRVRAAQHSRMQHARQMQVGDV